MLDPRISILGNSSIGIFGFSTNSFVLLPPGIKEVTLNTIKEHLNVPIVVSSVSNSHLNGIFSVGNSNHILFPDLISQSEYDSIENSLPENVSIHILDTKLTALGNTIITSDKRALVHKDYNSREQRQISDMLDVEVESRSFINNSLLGSLIFLSSKGFLTHPMLSEEDIEWISNYFGVPGDVVTVNRGTPYPRLGIISNNQGTLVGSDTTGPEIMRITEILQI
ncbi:MAG: translation initiation factor IF-6 [Candidatus Heimdallarchaeota archaeon]|nr:translation initiation factor IF-6 [Candidatus Heimdallarchaeota archaeon]